MKIYDISQEIFNCKVYNGDPIPEKNIINDIKKGDLYNLSSFSMCTHNGTHIDAPAHFIENGKTIEEIKLETFIGLSYVYPYDGILNKDDAIKIINYIKKINIEAAKRILFKGNIEITLEASDIFIKENILLLGNESQTTGTKNDEMIIHKKLLSADIVLLEGLCLDKVFEGIYFLNAIPLNLGSLEASPTRAILIDYK